MKKKYLPIIFIALDDKNKKRIEQIKDRLKNMLPGKVKIDDPSWAEVNDISIWPQYYWSHKKNKYVKYYDKRKRGNNKFTRHHYIWCQLGSNCAPICNNQQGYKEAQFIANARDDIKFLLSLLEDI